MENNQLIEITPKNFRTHVRLFVFLGIGLTLFTIFYFSTIQSPKDNIETTIHVSKGDSIKEISEELYNKKVVRSAMFLQSTVAFLGSDQNINLGDYKFKKGSSLFRVAYMLARGVHGVSPIKITIPEGSTNSEILNILESKVPNFDEVSFNSKVNNKQGYLFPDTYFFYPLTTVDEIVAMLEDTFTKKTKKLLSVGYKNYSKEEIIVMASIVEKEANGKEDAKIIAGILWKRLERGMLLQADAAPITYKVKGLPNSPIANSGLVSMEATIYPEDSPYLFYLHDKSGMIHLAKDYTEHKRNIAKYLR